MSTSTLKRAALAVAVLGVVGAGGAVAVKQNAAIAAAPVVAAATAPVAVPAPAISLPDFSVVVDHNGPAVVNISVTGSTKTAYDGDALIGLGGLFAVLGRVLL